MDSHHRIDFIRMNLAEVRRRISEAAKRASRSGDAIEIVAVTKGHSAETARAAFDAGLSDFGENYVQEALAKQDDLSDLTALRWHFIGHLQSNKAAQVVGRFALIQGIDSERLARRLSEAAERKSITQDVLVQVHLGDEATKFGVSVVEAPEMCEIVSRMPGLALRGLMGIAPQGGDPRPHFAAMRKLFAALPDEQRQVLSMGMSADYEVAIEEGATLVRIGTALLGSRPDRNP